MSPSDPQKPRKAKIPDRFPYDIKENPSVDSTNKISEAGDIDIVELGHAKEGLETEIFNYSVAYDTNNREPLFYESYPGSIVDISQLQFTLKKAKGYGYEHVGFILDRGYFCKENIE